MTIILGVPWIKDIVKESKTIRKLFPGLFLEVQWFLCWRVPVICLAMSAVQRAGSLC